VADLTSYTQDVCAFIDRYVKRNELGAPFALAAHQREVLRLMFAFDADGRLPYDTIIYSAIKKSGKTTINAAVTLWWALTQEAPNELKIAANDLEQSVSRVFKTIIGFAEVQPGAGCQCRREGVDDRPIEWQRATGARQRLRRRGGRQPGLVVKRDGRRAFTLPL
jgi:hypothetical protein